MAGRLQIIDAFTSRPFASNPAAVVLLEDNAWPAKQSMQQIAAEMTLSETPSPAGWQASPLRTGRLPRSPSDPAASAGRAGESTRRPAGRHLRHRGLA